MTYEEIVEKIREIVQEKDISMVKEHLAYQFNIVGEGEGRFYLEIKEGKAFVEPYEYYDHHACFICEADVLWEIMSGKLDPVKAFEDKKLHVERDLHKALKLKDFL